MRGRLAPKVVMPSGPLQLEQWLIRMRLTQAEGAERCQVSRVRFNQYLNRGYRPNLEAAVRIRDVTGIPVDAWLVDDRPRGESPKERNERDGAKVGVA